MNEFPKEEQEHVSLAVKRFEQMLRLKEAYFFDHDDLEDIISFYLQENLQQKALKAIRFASGQYPGSTVFVLRKSQVLAAGGQFQEALDLLEDLEIFEPGNPEIHITRGGIYSMTGNAAASIESYKAALRIDRSIEDIYLFIAFEFQNQHKYGQAARYIRKCLQMNPGNETALYEMSFCFDIAGKFKSGIRFFNTFLDTNPYSKVAWYVLGHLYCKQLDYHRAIEAFDFAIVVDENFAAAWFNKANCLMSLENYNEAISCYKETFRLEEPDPYTFLYLGECYENLQDHLQAMEYYRKAVEMDELLADGWAGIAVLTDYSGKISEAVVYLKRALNIEPDRATFWFILGDLQMRSGELPSAEESFRKVTECEPDYEDGWIYLSNLYLDQGKFTNALDVMTACMEFHQENPRMIYQSCEVLLQAGREQEALLICCRAFELDFDLHEKMLEELYSFGLNSEIRRLIEIYRTA